MSKIDFVIGFALARDWMVEMVGVILDNQLGYWWFTGVIQAWVMSSSVQDRTNKLWRQGCSGKDSCTPCLFKGHHLNLDRWHSGDDCRHIIWTLLLHRYCMFRGWGRIRIQYDWWCARNCSFQEFCNGLNCQLFIGLVHLENCISSLWWLTRRCQWDVPYTIWFVGFAC